MNKKITFYIVIIVLIIVVISILSSAFYTVQENEYALVLRFSKVEGEIVASPGIHFKIPIIDDVLKFPKTKLFHEIKRSDVLTSDIKAMTADCFIIWEIADPLVLYQNLYTMSGAKSRIENVTYNALQNTISTYRQSDIIGSADEQQDEQLDIAEPADEQDEQDNLTADEKSREHLNEVVTELTRKNLLEYGIKIVDVKIIRFDLPTANEQAVYTRMISERDRFARYERAEGEKEANIIKNEVDREANITVSDARARAEQIIAEGESEYMRLLAEAYKGAEREEFFSFMRGLEAAKTSLTDGGKTLILDKESILAQILIGP